MLNVLGRIFGTTGVIEKGLELIDEAWTSDDEEAENKIKIIQAKAKAKIDLMNSYAPFRVAQRYLSLMFAAVFLFIMANGVLGALYGVIDLKNVRDALDFANEMWLGEIMFAIISFYFGGGFIESWNRKEKK